MAELFEISGDPDAIFWGILFGSALFTNYPFWGLQTKMG